jgi:hypothetical protein
VGEVITEAVKPLLASGTWQGIVIAVLLALVVALAKVYGIDVLRFFKPSGPQAPADEGGPQSPGSAPVDSNGAPVATRPEGELGQGGEG